MNRFVMRPLICIMSLLGCTEVMASAFQIWEQDGASVGNYHAGYAAEANDASVAWYNPAGIPRIQNQQVVAGVSAIQTNFKYTGSLGITQRALTIEPTLGLNPVTVTFDSISANGGTFNVVPNLEYVAPISDWVGFGFSVVVPFGLKTDYGKDTPLRYAATLTSISVIDISPSLGMKISDKTYIGAGFDIQRAFAEFNSVGGLINPDPFLLPRTLDTSLDTYSKNKADDTGYGFHLGYLYEFNDCTRLGISYHLKGLWLILSMMMLNLYQAVQLPMSNCHLIQLFPCLEKYLQPGL
jgi:long-chain fatty acid transport protein